jgi:methionyl-tRNA formyltransferase
MRFGFVTCVQLGLTCMETIYKVGGSLDLAVTLPDDRATAKSGRIYLDDFCARHGIDLVKAPNVNDAAVIDAVRERGIDWLFIIGWSQIARRELLDAPTRGVLGMHPTLLPEGRGRAAVPWAILKGLPETGVTLFKLDEGVDTGPIVAQQRIPMHDTITATELYADVERAHSTLLAEAWPGLVNDRLPLLDQDLGAGSLWPGRRPEDGEIRADMTLEHGLKLVRATTRPYPGAFVRKCEKVLRIWSAMPHRVGSQNPQIALANGTIEAVDFDIEPLSH